MDISNSVLSAASPFQSREPDEIAPTLSINLSRSEQIDRKLAQIQSRQDRSYRRDLLRDSLIAKSAMRELERLLKKGQKQVDNSADPLASSNSDLGDSLESQLNDPLSTSLPNVSSGNIIVMGENISIDVSTDSINDVIDRINNSNAGVTASYNTTTNKFEITDTQDFTISNGNSGFFAELDVTTGTIESEEEDTQVTFFKSEKFLEAFNKFNRKMNAFFETAAEVSTKLGIANEEDDDGETLPDNPFTTKFKKAVEYAISSQYNEDFDGLGKNRFDFGFTISFSSGDFLELDAKEFERNLEGNVQTMLDFFLTEVDETNAKSGGMLGLLEKTFNTVNTELLEEINSKDKTGLLVDVEA